MRFRVKKERKPNGHLNFHTVDSLVLTKNIFYISIQSTPESEGEKSNGHCLHRFLNRNASSLRNFIIAPCVDHSVVDCSTDGRQSEVNADRFKRSTGSDVDLEMSDEESMLDGTHCKSVGCFAFLVTLFLIYLMQRVLY